MSNLKKFCKSETTNSLDFYKLSKYQINELKKSEEDIKYRRVISQEDLDKEDLEWLSNAQNL